MTNLFRRYCKDESGATAIEYCLCCMILLAAIISIVGVGGTVDALYQSLVVIINAMS